MIKFVLRQILEGEIKTIAFHKGIFQIENKEKYWLQIKTDQRSILQENLQELELNARALALLLEPQQATHAKNISSSLIFNLKVSTKENPYEYDYISFLLRKNLLITVTSLENEVFEEIEIESWSHEKPFNINIGHILDLMINEIIQDDMVNLIHARETVKKLSRKVDTDSSQINMAKVIKAKQDIAQLHNIIEDQFNMLNVIPVIEWTDFGENFHLEFLDTIKGFNQLINIAIRLDKKINMIQSQHQLILQEKGNRRLNTLTIVQSIFTPLTFLSGVYGMNFVNMPELKYPYGYHLTLGIMLGITLLQIWWFKSKGWFDK